MSPRKWGQKYLGPNHLGHVIKYTFLPCFPPSDGATKELDFGEPAQGALGCIQAEQFLPLDDGARFFDSPSSSCTLICPTQESEDFPLLF